MTEVRLPPYLFRGTTINWPGNRAAQELPMTYTSAHPVKALLFANTLRHKYPDSSVVYLALGEKLNTIPNDSENALSQIENEIGFAVTPTDFYPLCEGYIHAYDFQRIIHNEGMEVNHISRVENLTEICSLTPPISSELIERIASEALKFLKK